MGRVHRSLVVLVSGPVAAGKTSLVRELERGYGFDRFGTREFILTLLPKTELTRAALQAAGDQLDAETNGRWVAEGLVARMRDSDVPQRVAVDSVRITAQVEAARAITFITAYHVHLTASLAMLAERYGNACSPGASPGAHKRRIPAWRGQLQT